MIEDDLDWMIDQYLDGDLAAPEGAHFERMLSDPEVARAFSQALMIRALLQDGTGDEVPTGLADRINRTVGVGRELAEGAPARARRGIGLVGRGVAWIFEGPAMMSAGLPGVYWRVPAIEEEAAAATTHQGPLGRLMQRRQSGQEHSPGLPLRSRLLRRAVNVRGRAL